MAAHALDITSNTIKYRNQVYALRNLTRINKVTSKLKPKVSGGVTLICGALLLLCIYYPLLLTRLYENVLGTPVGKAGFGAFFIVLSAVCLYGVWERTRLTVHTLVIETNAGTADLFTSRDRHVIDDVTEKIHQAMENPAGSLSYHVNLGDVINTHGNNNKVISRTTMGDFH